MTTPSNQETSMLTNDQLTAAFISPDHRDNLEYVLDKLCQAAVVADAEDTEAAWAHRVTAWAAVVELVGRRDAELGKARVAMRLAEEHGKTMLTNLTTSREDNTKLRKENADLRAENAWLCDGMPRYELDAAKAEVERLTAELATKTEVARSNKRHVAILAEEVERLESELRTVKRRFVARLRNRAQWHVESGSPGDATLNDLADILDKELNVGIPFMPEPADETAYLTASPANEARLAESVARLDAGEPDDAATILQGALGGRWKIGQQLGTFGGNTPCDAPGGGGSYLNPDGSVSCRCVVCSRCGRHTGNSNQGHFWKFCSVTKSLREFHSCCPGDCELEVPPQAASSVDGEPVGRIEFVPATAANILGAIMQNEAAWDKAHHPNANCSKADRHAPHVWGDPEHWCDGEDAKLFGSIVDDEPNSHPSPTISHVREFDGEVSS